MSNIVIVEAEALINPFHKEFQTGRKRIPTSAGYIHFIEYQYENILSYT